MKEIIKIKTEEYLEKFRKNKGGIKSLKWNSYSSVALRYVNLLRDIDFHNKSILDVGCGFGDIIPYIYCKSSNFKYLGVDIVPEFIIEARKRYPDYKFEIRDFFSDPLNAKFDYILCCGALNGNYQNNLAYRKKLIEIMFDNCKVAVAFNMAGGIGIRNKKNSMIYYVNSIKMLNFCIKLSSKIIFKQHYHKKDFTIILFK